MKVLFSFFFFLFIFHTPLIAQPSNNSCANAILLQYSGSCNYATFSNTNATNSGVATATCGSAPNTDVWFKFVMPNSGNIIIQTNYVNFRGAMAVYRGKCDSLTQYKCDDNSGVDYLMPYIEIQDKTYAGDTLLLQYWGDNNTSGDFQLCIFEPTRPQNRLCSTSDTLTVQRTCNSTSYTTLYAGSSGVAAPSCGNYLNNDVWFNVVVPASGHLVLTTVNKGIGDAVMAIYEGNCNALKAYACDNNSGAYYLQPEIRIRDTGLANKCIYVRIWRNNSIYGGAFDICAFEPKLDSNETCERAKFIAPTQNCDYKQYTNYYYNSSGKVTPPCGNYSGSDAWFKTVVPQSGKLVISTRNINLGDLVLATYTGSCDTLTLYTCENGNGPYYLQPEIVIDDTTVAGDTLYIMAWKNGDIHGGAFEMCIFEPEIPHNKNCRSARLFKVKPDCNFVNLTNQYAQTSGDGNPSCGNYDGTDIWVKFVVPNSGEFTIDTKPGSLNNVDMALYSGTCGALSPYACAHNGSAYGNWMPKIEVKDSLLANQTMYLQLWNNGNVNGGTFNVCIFGKLEPEVKGYRDYAICEGDTLPVLTVTEGVFQYNWYDSKTGGNLLAADTHQYQPTKPGTYYVDAVNPVTQQKSARIAILLQENKLPKLVGATDIANCSGQAFKPLFTQDLGAMYHWYGDSSGINILALDTNEYLPNNPGDYFLQALDVATGCNSRIKKLSFQVLKTPDIVNLQGENTCASSPNSRLSVADKGAHYYWYFDSLGKSLLAVDTFQTTVNKTGTFWVTAVDSTNLCRSAVHKVFIEVFENPLVVNPQGASVCGLGTSAVLSVKDLGDTYTWYKDSIKTTIIQRDTHSIEVMQAGDYWVQAQSNEGCLSNVQRIHYQIGIAPQLVNIKGFTGCDLSGYSGLSVNNLGHIYNWYSDSLASIPLQLDSFKLYTDKPGTYYVRAVDRQTGCGSALKKAALVLTGRPIVVNPQGFSGCSNVGYSGLKVADQGEVYNWYNQPVAGTLLATNTAVFFPASNGNYYVEAVNPTTSCKSAIRERVTLAINSPTKPLIALGTDSLHTNDAQSFQWYKNNTAIFGQTRKSCPLSGNGLYFVAVVDFNNCKSHSDTVSIVVSGINRMDKADIKIFPNPFVNQTQIEVDPAFIGSTCDIFTLQGKKVYATQLRHHIEVLSLPDLQSGTYLFTVHNASKRKTFVVIKR